MIKSIRFFGAFALGVFCCCMASGQTQELPRYSSDACVKVRDGKGEEYAAFLRDVSTKIAKARIDAGVYASYTIAKAVVPVGRSARCDYHLAAGYIGFPPDMSDPEKLEADMHKAGITMSRAAMIAKREELSYLVGVDIWRWQAGAGTLEKGSYAGLNYYKIKAGSIGQWVQMESDVWTPVAEATAKDYPGTAFRAATLVMPGGAGRPYNGISVDSYPSWAAFGKGLPKREIWNKVHPNSDLSAFSEQFGTIAEHTISDIVKVIEVLRKK